LDDATFTELVDGVFMEIEDRIDELDADIDVDSSGGILNLTLEDDSSIILSRQIGSHEIWVAAKSGGFHLRNVDDDWQCDATGENLKTLVDRVFTEQAGEVLFG
jgi:CyaY protein